MHYDIIKTGCYTNVISGCFSLELKMTSLIPKACENCIDSIKMYYSSGQTCVLWQRIAVPAIKQLCVVPIRSVSHESDVILGCSGVI